MDHGVTFVLFSVAFASILLIKLSVEGAVSFVSFLTRKLEFLRVIITPTKSEVIASDLAQIVRRDGTARWPSPDEPSDRCKIEIWYSRVACRYVVATRERTAFVMDSGLEKEILLRLHHVRELVDSHEIPVGGAQELRAQAVR